ncbi:DUF1499 domain-containing protein [Verrucomicrobia bacterium]|nr:DUF1499 domain-containing protein [bacterium]MDC0266514.1 DUF1499 domain-containing protein [bacterium]MDC0295713.1 DUF1499 domain-containing protein [bacterium]MDC0299161.1 DUF1499 domain-containing protein [Verrucomicrobiota bacterium]
MSQTLEPCPNSPNCVSSQSSDPGHHIQPVRFSIASDKAWHTWKELIQAQRNLVAFDADRSYLRAIFATPIFRFKDQVTCLLDQESRIIHVRSASNIGYWDLGVNRRRIENLRSAFDQEIEVQHAH